MAACRSGLLALLLAAWLLPLESATTAAADGHPKIDPADGWTPLFNGKDLAGWQLSDVRGKAEPGAWVVEDGVITRKGKGYLSSAAQYGDFILDLEFKVGPETNSGIILRFDPAYSAGTKMYWWNGLLEVQLLDSYGKAEPDKHDCGALYDMIAPSQNTMHKAGQWNRITITARGSRISAVMNGAKILDVNLDDWTEAEKNPDGTPNKYHKPMKDVPRRGFILLQDHPGEIWFRNIYLKRLD